MGAGFSCYPPAPASRAWAWPAPKGPVLHLPQRRCQQPSSAGTRLCPLPWYHGGPNFSQDLPTKPWGPLFHSSSGLPRKPLPHRPAWVGCPCPYGPSCKVQSPGGDLLRKELPELGREGAAEATVLFTGQPPPRAGPYPPAWWSRQSHPAWSCSPPGRGDGGCPGRGRRRWLCLWQPWSPCGWGGGRGPGPSPQPSPQEQATITLQYPLFSTQLLLTQVFLLWHLHYRGRWQQFHAFCISSSNTAPERLAQEPFRGALACAAQACLGTPGSQRSFLMLLLGKLCCCT